MKQKQKNNHPPNASTESRFEMSVDQSEQPITNMIHQANFQSGISSDGQMKKQNKMKSR